jgi:phage tail tape-measure protein
MDTGAFSPEELETLLEDAVVLGDGMAVAQLFERDGVIVPRAGSAEARGRAAITALARDL